MKIIITSDLHYGFNEKTHRKLESFWKKVNKENPDLIILAGDLISHQQKSFKQLFKQIRKYFLGNIGIVFGNHDYYNPDDNSFSDILEISQYHQKILTEFNIIDLNNEDIQNKQVWITGFDGWYDDYNPPSNDMIWMPFYTKNIPTHQWMNQQAHYSLESILQKVPIDNRIKLCVTHFTPFSPLFDNTRRYGDLTFQKSMSANPKYLDFIKEKFNYLICGHNHQQIDLFIDNLHVINSGSDYNCPKMKIIDI